MDPNVSLCGAGYVLVTQAHSQQELLPPPFGRVFQTQCCIQECHDDVVLAIQPLMTICRLCMHAQLLDQLSSCYMHSSQGHCNGVQAL